MTNPLSISVKDLIDEQKDVGAIYYLPVVFWCIFNQILWCCTFGKYSYFFAFCFFPHFVYTLLYIPYPINIIVWQI